MLRHRKVYMGKTIRMSKTELISEHKHLLDVLQRPSRAKLEAEARKQGKELNEYLEIK